MLELKEDEKRTKRVTLMITDTEFRALKAKADAELRSPSQQASIVFREGMLKSGLVKWPDKKTGRD